MIVENKDYELKMMVAIYERDSKIERNSENDYYLETHLVYADPNGRPALREGTPLRQETFNDMRKYFTTKRVVEGKERILSGNPSKFLHCDMRFEKQQYLWFCPASKKELYFSKGAKVKDGTMWIPNLIFYSRGNSELHVFATKDDVINERTQLFNAPFLNVYQSGNICLGDASRKNIKEAKTFDQYRQAWEELFFLSKFSHGVATFPDIVASKNIHKLTRELIESGSPFPETELMPNNKYETYGELINDL